MSQRLSRKEIKHDVREDAFRQSVEKSYEYVADHRRLLLGVIAAVVAVALGVVALRAWLERRDRDAALLLARAVEVYEAPVVATGARPEDAESPSFPDEASRTARARELFSELREEYGGTGAGAVAGVYLGRLELQEGDEAAARELWDEFLEEHEGHMLAAAVRTSLLDLDRRAGKGEQVAQELRTALEGDDRQLPEDVLLYQLGVTLEQLGRAEEARDAYQRLADEYPDSPFAAQAMAKARELAPGEPS